MVPSGEFLADGVGAAVIHVVAVELLICLEVSHSKLLAGCERGSILPHRRNHLLRPVVQIARGLQRREVARGGFEEGSAGL